MRICVCHVPASADKASMSWGRLSPFCLCRFNMLGVLMLEPVTGKEEQFEKELKLLETDGLVTDSFWADEVPEEPGQKTEAPDS